MNEALRIDAARVRQLLISGPMLPDAFAAALYDVPRVDRDAWFDSVLGMSELPDDGPQLPAGCAPYLPCSVETLLRVIEHAQIDASDVFVDVGAGPARATTFVHLMSGAAAIGLEIQPALVSAGSDLTTRLNASRIATVHGDATRLAGRMVTGTVFFLYCPFSGARLDQLLAELEPIAAARPIRLCCVDLMLPRRDWFELELQPSEELAIYRSTLVPVTSRRA